MQNQSKKTLILGASDNPSRYSYLALNSLRKHGHPVVAIGKKSSKVADVEVTTEKKELKDIDTITVYLNPANQKAYYDYIFSLRPRRVIFNPGAENPELIAQLRSKGIEPVEACSLVLLSTGQY
jgi:predicted CoA-binding protein